LVSLRSYTSVVHECAPRVGILIGSGCIRPGPGRLPPGVRFIAEPYVLSTLTEAVSALA